MKAYKGFDKNMQSNGYQFAEGETYVHDGPLSLCESGFHACQDPIDCMAYYDPYDSVYHAVEVDDVSDERGDDTKIVCKKIRIGARIGIAEMVKASIGFAFASCKSARNIGSSRMLASRQAASGYGSRQAASGHSSCQETTGKNCVMMSAGNNGKARGKVGSWIVLTEWVDGVPDVVAKRIDGEEIKEDTWYMAKDGKLVEAK